MRFAAARGNTTTFQILGKLVTTTVCTSCDTAVPAGERMKTAAAAITSAIKTDFFMAETSCTKRYLE